MSEERQSTEPGGERRFSFGEFVLDTAAVELRRGDEEIALPPRAFDLLEYLVRRPGRLLPKEELLDAVWEGRFVGEESLTQAVSLIRQALGDHPQEPVFIRTVPKRGYVFVADLVAEAPSTQVTYRPGRGSPAPAVRAWKWAVGFVLLALVAVSVAWLASRGEPGGEEEHVMRLTVNLASASGGDMGIQGRAFAVPFAISPDGTRLVVRGDDGKGDRYFLREIGGFEMTAMAGTEDIRARPVFSPDGEWLLLKRGDAIEKISVRGGSPIEIATVPEKFFTDWGADDTILMTGGGSVDLIEEISASNGERRAITGIDGSDGAMIYPVDLLPDGKSMLVVAHTVEPWKFALEILSRSTGERRRILETAGLGARYLPNGYLVYGRGNTLFAVPVDERSYAPLGTPVPVLVGIAAPGGFGPWYAVSETGTLVYLSTDSVSRRHLVWVNRDGSESPVPGGQLEYRTVRISPDGRKAALTLTDGMNLGIWVLDLESGTLIPVAATGWNSLPNWSPDGTTLTYWALRGDGHGLSRRRADGSGAEERLLVRSQRVFPRHWSPDGRRLVFWEGRRIWQYMDGEVMRLDLEPSGARSFRFSPDGRLVAFEGREGDFFHVYIQPFPGSGSRIQVSPAVDSRGQPGEGRSPNWRADGKELYYYSHQAVFAVEVEAEPELRVGSPRLLFEGDYYMDFDTTPDGERFLMRTPGVLSLPRELQVVLNWFDEVERLAPHPHH